MPKLNRIDIERVGPIIAPGTPAPIQLEADFYYNGNDEPTTTGIYSNDWPATLRALAKLVEDAKLDTVAPEPPSP